MLFVTQLKRILGYDKGMLTGSISSDPEIEFGDIGEIKLSKDFFIFGDNGKVTNLDVTQEERQLVLY